MKSFILCAGLALGTALIAAAQAPNITYISNSASYLPPGLPNSGLAQGSIITIFGTNIGPTTAASATSFPLGNTLGGSSVTFTVGGMSTQGLMLFTSAGQLSAVLPSDTPLQTGTVTVSFNGQMSNTLPITVVASNFGMYTLPQNGSGPAVITTPTYKVVTLTSPAKPGDTLVLWGTGLGPYSGDETMPPMTPNGLNVNATVYVGDQPATILYKGRTSYAGLDQINFTVPAGLSGCYVPVVAVVNGITSNFGSVSISSDGSTCSDPAGLPSSAINEVTSNNSLKVGFISLQKVSFSATVPILGPLNVKQDTGDAYFYNFNDQALIASRGISAISSFSSCTVLVCTNSDTCIPNSTGLIVPELDAGPNITINGPSGSVTLPKSTTHNGEYHGPLGSAAVIGAGTPDYLQEGNYTATGTGGADVKAFTANLTIGPPLTWSNMLPAGASIDRTKDLTITYNGGGPNDYVAIFGASTANTSSGDNTVTFVCTEKASAGTFTVPSYVLSALPASGTISIDGISGTGGFLLVGNYPLSNTFTAPGLDLGFFSETVVSGVNLAYK